MTNCTDLWQFEFCLKTSWQLPDRCSEIYRRSKVYNKDNKKLQFIMLPATVRNLKNLTLGSWSCLSSSKRQIPIKCKALCTWASEKHLDLRLSALSKINFIKLIKTSLSMIFNKGRNCLVNFGGFGGGVHSGSPASFLLCL